MGVWIIPPIPERDEPLTPTEEAYRRGYRDGWADANRRESACLPPAIHEERNAHVREYTDRLR